MPQNHLVNVLMRVCGGGNKKHANKDAFDSSALSLRCSPRLDALRRKSNERL